MVLSSVADHSVGAVCRNRQVHLNVPADWPDGTKLVVTPLSSEDMHVQLEGHVIIVGFGLAGRYVADLLEKVCSSCTIIEKNPVTVKTQQALGRNIVEGDATDAETLIKAGLNTAEILALTIPDEEAVLNAISLARRLQPQIYIIARTNYSSKGMRASQLGADDVIKAEQAVALQFYDKLCQRIKRIAEHDS